MDDYTVSSEWLYRVRDALQDLVAENTEQRSRIAALEAQIERDRVKGAEAVLNEQLRTAALEAVIEDVRKASVEPLGWVEFGCEVERIIAAAPSTVLVQMIREAKAEAVQQQFDTMVIEWSTRTPMGVVFMATDEADARQIASEFGDGAQVTRRRVGPWVPVDSSAVEVPATNASETASDLKLGDA